MSAFEKVIGYEQIKENLIELCDILKNPDPYKKLGAKVPKGLAIYGDPGLGKTLMAKCVIEESGRKCFTVRRTSDGDKLSTSITKSFEEARNNSPSIIFLDDLDKFANDDERHKDSEEYVTVQACIDESKEFDVFVLATINDRHKLPDSLLREGRFDWKIEVEAPDGEDTKKIIEYYLRDKKLDEDVNIDDIYKMLNYSSCARLETILNEAARFAGYHRKSSINMDDFVKAVLEIEYDVSDNYMAASDEDLKMTAVHEAGHIVVSEYFCPGCVGLASVRDSHNGSGFVRRYKSVPSDANNIAISLAGKAAVSIYDLKNYKGIELDLQKAYWAIVRCVTDYMELGYGFGHSESDLRASEEKRIKIEHAIEIKLYEHEIIAKDILLKNKEFLEALRDELLEKKTLLYSDIQRIKKQLGMVVA